MVGLSEDCQEERKMSGIQVFDILEAVPQITEERMVQVFEHSSFTDDVPYAFRSYNCSP